MPPRPARQCGYPGCRVLTNDGTARCAKHPRQAWAKPEDAPTRLRGRDNQKRRVRLLNLHPLCVTCEAAGRTTAATVIDHVVPLSQGGADTDYNLQQLCAACHDAKSAAERAAIARGGGG
jgi:5-methylcytosine-specific restriction protein A